MNERKSNIQRQCDAMRYWMKHQFQVYKSSRTHNGEHIELLANLYLRFKVVVNHDTEVYNGGSMIKAMNEFNLRDKNFLGM